MTNPTLWANAVTLITKRLVILYVSATYVNRVGDLWGIIIDRFDNHLEVPCNISYYSLDFDM